MGTVTDAKLKEAMGALCDRLAAHQEPLGEEFAQVLDDNRWDLYETDDTTLSHPLINEVVSAVRQWLWQKRRVDDLHIDVYVRGDASTWVSALHSKLPRARREGRELCYGDSDSDESRLSLMVISLEGKSHVKVSQGMNSDKIVFVQH